MDNKDYENSKHTLTEQKISKVISVDANSTGIIEIKIPNNRKTFVAGYGYSYKDNSEFTLHAGTQNFPKRSDQEGSISQPMMYSIPFRVLSGQSIQFVIKNNNAESVTYNAVFLLRTDGILDEESQGGEMVMTTTQESGGVGFNAISNSSGTLYADVILREDGKNALVVDTEMKLHTDNVTLSNVYVSSTDGTVGNAGYSKMDSNRRLEVISGESRNVTHDNHNVTTSSSLLNQGIRLNPNGGSYEMSKENGNLSTDAVNVISGTSNKNLLVTEFE